MTEESHIAPHPGNGLGIVAADLTGEGQLDLFIATDMQPNLFFVNEGGTNGTPEFAESAAAVGLAYDQNGNPQACMGVAAGDADGNGLLDLFVTNFHPRVEHAVLAAATGPLPRREPAIGFV